MANSLFHNGKHLIRFMWQWTDTSLADNGTESTAAAVVVDVDDAAVADFGSVGGNH